MATYEYKLYHLTLVQGDHEAALNALAAEGWRVAHVAPPARVVERNRNVMSSSSVSTLILEREQQSS